MKIIDMIVFVNGYKFLVALKQRQDSEKWLTKPRNHGII